MGKTEMRGSNTDNRRHGQKRAPVIKREMLPAILSGVLSAFVVWAIHGYTGDNYHLFETGGSGLPASSVLNVGMFLVCWWLFYSVRSADRRKIRFSLIYGMLMSAAMICGRSLDQHNHLTQVFFPAEHLFTSLVIFLSFTALIAAICIRFFSCIEKVHIIGTDEKNIRSPFLICWGIIFLAWIPALLAYWPGIFTYDILRQSEQAMGPISGFNRIHPPLHTMFLALCIRVGKGLSITPVTVYSLIQMLAVSAIFSEVIVLLRKLHVHPALLILTLAYFALNPVLAIFSMISTKDVLFGAFLMLLFMQCVLLIKDPDNFLRQPSSIIRFAVCGTMTLLLRNNALYVLLLAFPFFLMGLRKKAGRIVLLFALCILPYGFINGPVYDMLGIQPGAEKEKLAVPLSQLANVTFHELENLSEEEIASLNGYFPVDDISRLYNPRFIDPLKREFNQAYYQQDRGTFFRLWVNLFHKYPLHYLEAFLDLNLPYWYPDADTVDRWSKRAYIETYVWRTHDYYTERNSKLPALLPLYDKVANFSAFESVPLLNTLFSISTPIWFLLLCGMTLGYRRRWRLVLPLLLPFFLWLTYMAGPVSNFRYIEPLIAMYPLWITMVLQPDRFYTSDAI